MELMLGTYTPKLDDKGRLILPAKFRGVLQSGLVLTRGQERCLYIMTDAEFRRMYELIQNSELPNKRAIARLFTADASSDTPDKQGRVLIPGALRQYASLNDSITVIGAGSRIELWNSQSWANYQDENIDDYASMSQEVF